MSTVRMLTLLLLVVACAACTGPVRAEDEFGFDTSLNVYTESPYSKLPLKSVHSDTKIDGPIARSRIVYKFIDGLSETIEVGLNFRLPDGAILNGFGYYYGTRFIAGKMYDNDQAWRIYTAVTSRGRDPGIMDRPEQQDYHTQIYPVLPGQFLTVVVDITQMMPTDQAGAHFTLPLEQSDEVHSGFAVDSRVTINGMEDASIVGNYGDRTTVSSRDGRMGVHLVGEWKPTEDWQLTIPRPRGVTVSSFSRLPAGRGSGAYAATIRVPYRLTGVRIALGGGGDTNLSMPTLFGNVAAFAPISFTGRYRNPEYVWVTVRSTNHRPIRLKFALSPERIVDYQNPAARIWADKRISALQDSSRDRKAEVIHLSKLYTVVSNFTALLAIPKEELENYRRRLAAQQSDTNTHTIGGGGGDPFIRVTAPADAKQVVAVFPDGSAKNLDYDSVKRSWVTRFDYPFGTPVGEYDVTIIVVHADGNRSRFVLEYENLLSAPKADPVAAALSAIRGQPVSIRVRSMDAVKATLVTPWSDRLPMTEVSGEWSAKADVPVDCVAGRAQLLVVLYDGAHNRTEVTIDVNVE